MFITMLLNFSVITAGTLLLIILQVLGSMVVLIVIIIAMGFLITTIFDVLVINSKTWVEMRPKKPTIII